MTGLARNIFVLANQFIRSRIVIKALFLDLPVLCGMAYVTAYLQRIPVGGLSEQLYGKQQSEYYRWHLEHSMSLNLYSTYVPLEVVINLWQSAQATSKCAPSSLNLDELWLNFESFQLLVLWHLKQSVFPYTSN